MARTHRLRGRRRQRVSVTPTFRVAKPSGYTSVSSDAMADEEEVPAGPKANKALIVLTSIDAYPDGSPTGFWLAEAAHPYAKFGTGNRQTLLSRTMTELRNNLGRLDGLHNTVFRSQCTPTADHACQHARICDYRRKIFRKFRFID